MTFLVHHHLVCPPVIARFGLVVKGMQRLRKGSRVAPTTSRLWIEVGMGTWALIECLP
jgi:hypothetical protein